MLVSFVCIAYIGARTRDQEPADSSQDVQHTCNAKLHVIGAGECAELPVGHHVGREPFKARIALGTCKRKKSESEVQQLPAFLCIGAVPTFAREHTCFRKEVPGESELTCDIIL